MFCLLVSHIIHMRSYAPKEWQGKFDSLIRRLMLNLGNDLSYWVWPHLAKYCVDLYNDEYVKDIRIDIIIGDNRFSLT